MDDRFYNLEDEGHLQRFQRMMDELTLEDVNAAIKRHLQYENLKIAVVTGDAAGLRDALVADSPSPMVYDTPKPDAILQEDREIESFPLAISAEHTTVLPVDSAFER
jgi:zinc protease